MPRRPVNTDESDFFFNSFLKDVSRDLKKHGTSYVFNKTQLEEVKKIFDVKIIGDDGCCIYIKMKGDKLC